MKTIAAGPERIESQFAISYSMVLNLLSTRTLPACQDFLSRSFLRHQATKGADRSLAMAVQMDEQAAALEAKVEGLSLVSGKQRGIASLQVCHAFSALAPWCT